MTLQEKLENSETVRALRAESTVFRLLRGHHWECFHGPFYPDPTEGKLREIDVVARQHWKPRSRKSQWFANLNLVVEVKSARDWQIVFSGNSYRVTPAHIHRHWLGYLTGSGSRWARAVLQEQGVSAPDQARLLQLFEDIVFKDDSAVFSKFFPTAPPSRHTASTFRETNTDKEKDLEASVLWRAILALRAATGSMANSIEAWHKAFYVNPNLLHSAPKDVESEFVWATNYAVRAIDWVHPVVVIDAQLWLANHHKLQAVPSCRFMQLDPRGGVQWWCDVVNSQRLEKYLAEVSKHYRGLYTRNKATLQRSSMERFLMSTSG